MPDGDGIIILVLFTVLALGWLAISMQIIRNDESLREACYRLQRMIGGDAGVFVRFIKAAMVLCASSLTVFSVLIWIGYGLSR